MRYASRQTPPLRVAFLFNLKPPMRWLAACAITALLASCARGPDLAVTPLKPPTFAALQSYLLSHKPEVDQFRLRGPFAVTAETNHQIHLSARETIAAD